MLNLNEKNGFWDLVAGVSAQALISGSLKPVDTEYEYVTEAGINFVVRIISRLAEKPAGLSAERTNETHNPFLPHEKDLFVSEISSSHICLLNKFNVIPNHVLIVTREFEQQNTVLSSTDFKSLWTVIEDGGGLGFYNSGAEAGASQPHKHIQVIPLPHDNQGHLIPLGPAIEELLQNKDSAVISLFNFKHKIVKLEPLTTASSVLHEKYRHLLEEFDLVKDNGTDSQPYNLLVTSRWMMLIPRSREFVDTISINAIGYAGGLLVKNHDELETVRKIGPSNMLRQAGVSN